MVKMFRVIIKEKDFCPQVKIPPDDSDKRYEFVKECISLYPDAEIITVVVYDNDMWSNSAESWVMMHEGYKSMDEYEKIEAEKVEAVLLDIANRFGKAYRKNIEACMSESEFSHGLEIVENPRGKRQDENWKSFKHIYVDQWSVGMEGDSFEGYVCIPLPDKKYLQFQYSC